MKKIFFFSKKRIFLLIYLGVMYHEGDGVSKDMKKAAGFFLEGHGVAKLGINNLLLTSRILKAGA